MNDEFLKSYQGLPTSLLNLAESIQPSALLAGCQFDTQDCAHDTCSSDCVDCSDCSDAHPVTYPYITSGGSTSSSINWTVHHGTQTTYNYFRTIVKRGTTTVQDSGWGYADDDYIESIAGLPSGTTYTVYLYYSNSGSGTGTSAGSVSITTQGSPPSPKYTIIATVNFDAAGGLVSPTSITEKGYGRPKPYGTLSIDFPKPTRDGYIFLYWLLDGYTTHWPAGANDIYATSSGETYTARAQWEKQTVSKAFIGDGGVWKQAVPYIGDGSVWKPISESIGDGGTWK